MIPYEKFDRSKLSILPLEERIHDIDLEKVAINPGDTFREFDHPALDPLADAVINAKKQGATVLMMYGARSSAISALTNISTLTPRTTKIPLKRDCLPIRLTTNQWRQVSAVR